MGLGCWFLQQRIWGGSRLQPATHSRRTLNGRIDKKCGMALARKKKSAFPWISAMRALASIFPVMGESRDEPILALIGPVKMDVIDSYSLRFSDTFSPRGSRHP
jgi:hypothetical protein